MELLDYDQWLAMLQSKVESMPRTQVRLVNLEVLPRLGKTLSENAKDCETCYAMWEELQKSTEHLEEFFNDGNTYMKDFDKTADKIMTHLKSKHGMFAKGYILSKVIFISMFIGVCVGLIIGLVFDKVSASILITWTLSIFFGWIYGSKLEKKKSKQNLQF